MRLAKLDDARAAREEREGVAGKEASLEEMEVLVHEAK